MTLPLDPGLLWLACVAAGVLAGIVVGIGTDSAAAGALTTLMLAAALFGSFVLSDAPADPLPSSTPTAGTGGIWSCRPANASDPVGEILCQPATMTVGGGP
jgi:hypothetical protein